MMNTSICLNKTKKGLFEACHCFGKGNKFDINGLVKDYKFISVSTRIRSI